MPSREAASRSISIADMRRGDLLVRGDVLQFRQLLHRRFDDRRPMVQLVVVGVGQRVLVLRAAQAAADADVLPRLHEEFGAFDRRHLRPQALDDLVGGHVALVMRLQLNEHAAGVLGRVVGVRAGEIEHAGDGRVLARRSRRAGASCPAIFAKEMSWRASAWPKMKPVSCCGKNPLGIVM